VSGDTYWNYTLTPLREPDGSVDRVMLVGTEVTDEVLARKEMQEAIALKDQFLGLVSHELRTPISTVIANALILRRRGDRLSREDREQAIEDIATEADKLQKVIENLLLLTRMEAASDVAFRPLSLQEIVARQVSLFSRSNPARTIESLGEEMVTVMGQEDLIGIVLSNLIGNANKYSPADSLIEVSMESNEGREVVVHVRDQGIGLDEADLPNLFAPFYRTGGARKYATGMGLGLAVSKRIIEAHGGRIWASPRPEGGADFAFALPRAAGS
jgi:signal transduction histidine kinase